MSIAGGAQPSRKQSSSERRVSRAQQFGKAHEEAQQKPWPLKTGAESGEGEPESRVTLKYVPRVVSIYRVLEPELDRLFSGQSEVHFAMFGISFGAALALTITLSTVSILDAHIHAVFWAAFVAFMMMMVYFGIRAYSDRREAKGQIRRIKQNPDGSGDKT